MIAIPAEILAALITPYEISPESLTFLGGGREDSDGIAYTYSRAGVKERVLKILALPGDSKAGLARIGERLKFVHFLGERGAPIVYPLPARDGRLLATASSANTTFVAYSMEKAAGILAQPGQWSDGFIHNWGKTIGQLHRIAQCYPVWRQAPGNGADGPLALGWMEEWHSFYASMHDPEIRSCWLAIRERLAKLPVTRDAYGFIHNDPHIQNILVDGEKIVLLDFDVATTHWFVNDIAIALQGLLFAQSGGMERPVADPAPLHTFLDFFMRGYETENHLERHWLDQLDLMISYRRILLFTVMQGWLKSQPAVRAGWKDMILKEPPVVGNLPLGPT